MRSAGICPQARNSVFFPGNGSDVSNQQRIISPSFFTSIRKIHFSIPLCAASRRTSSKRPAGSESHRESRRSVSGTFPNRAGLLFLPSPWRQPPVWFLLQDRVVEERRLDPVPAIEGVHCLVRHDADLVRCIFKDLRVMSAFWTFGIPVRTIRSSRGITRRLYFFGIWTGPIRFVFV